MSTEDKIIYTVTAIIVAVIILAYHFVSSSCDARGGELIRWTCVSKGCVIT